MNEKLEIFERKIQAASDAQLLDSFSEYVSIDSTNRTTEQHEAVKMLREEILSRMSN